MKPCCIGDCVMALPAVDALAKASASGAVDVFCGSHSMAVFEARATVARLRACPETFSVSTALSFGMRDLRAAGAKRLVVLDRSRWLRIAARLSGARERHAVSATEHEERHESQVYTDLVRSLGVQVHDAVPRIEPDELSRARAEDLVARNRGYAVIHPGGGDNPGASMLEKRWPAKCFADVGRWLATQGLAVYVTGSTEERQLALDVAEAAELPANSVLAGRCDLRTTAAIIASCEMYIGGDTGVSHIAAATGAPVVAIFGPTNPRRYRPLGVRVRVVAPPESWEIPDVDLRRASLVRDSVSIRRVTTTEVINACSDLMNAHSSAGGTG